MGEKNRMEGEERNGKKEKEGSVGEKRKFEESVKKKIIILLSCEEEGDVTGGLFELNVKIIGGSIIELETCTIDNNIIELTQTFFLKSGPSSTSPGTPLGACVIGDELFMIPDDSSYYDSVQQSPPLVFNLVTNNFSHNAPPTRFPPQRKINPLLTAIGDTVYALSFRDPNSEKPFPQPSFESFNLKKNGADGWTPLRSSLFQETPYMFKGHAVLGESFILVCLETFKRRLHIPYRYYSYNFATGFWKTVATTDTKGEFSFPLLIGEGAVLGNDIYTFHSFPPGGMYVFSYSLVKNGDDDDGPDILLSPVKQVDGLELDHKWSRGCYPRTVGLEYIGGTPCALVIVKDQILCLLYPLYLIRDRVIMQVCGLFFQLQSRESCTSLKSFTCHVDFGDHLYTPHIAFATVLLQIHYTVFQRFGLRKIISYPAKPRKRSD